MPRTIHTGTRLREIIYGVAAHVGEAELTLVTPTQAVALAASTTFRDRVAPFAGRITLVTMCGKNTSGSASRANRPRWNSGRPRLWEDQEQRRKAP